MQNSLPVNAVTGAVAGDIIGSPYEFNPVKTVDFPLFTPASDFTDDTVLTVAVADALMKDKDFKRMLWEYGRRYPGRGYGGNFLLWLLSDNPQPYNSFGNGSAMRVSPVGLYGRTMEEVLDLARQTAEVSHNHPEGIKGAQATAAAVFLANRGASKKEIKDFIEKTFGYSLDFTIEEIRPFYAFNEICQDTVPQAIVAFLDSRDYEDAVRLAVSLGGDADTLACITGGIAAAFYKEIPEHILTRTAEILPEEFKAVMREFMEVLEENKKW